MTRPFYTPLRILHRLGTKAVPVPTRTLSTVRNPVFSLITAPNPAQVAETRSFLSPPIRQLPFLPMVIPEILSEERFSGKSVFVALLVALGLTTSQVHAEALPPTSKLKDRFTSMFPDEEELFDGFTRALTDFNKNKDPDQVIPLFKRLATKASVIDDLTHPLNKDHQELGITIYDQVLQLYRRIELRFPNVDTEPLEITRENLQKKRKLALSQISLAEQKQKNEQAALLARSFLDEMKRNPLAIATTGAAITAVGAAAVQFALTGTIDPWTVATSAGAGFVVSSIGVLLYDWAYQRKIWQEFEANHPIQSVAFSTINIILTSWGIAVAAGAIPNTPEAAKALLSYIAPLKEQVLAMPIKEEYATPIVKSLESLTEANVQAFLTNAKQLGSNPKKNAALLGFIANALKVDVNNIASLANDTIKTIKTVNIIIGEDKPKDDNKKPSAPTVTPKPMPA